MSTTYLLLCWSALYFGIKYYESLQKQREAALRSAALAQEAQLKMLRYQLNPHFLFNTLNAISTLILDNQNRTANHAVTRLSEFLRYTLDQDPMKKVTLRQEIEALDLYMNTERLRFGDRLRLEYAVEEPALDALVPSLLLQPLIENAVKYAISPREDGGSIRIEGRARGAMLEVTVIDDGPGLRDGNALIEGRGVGLRNTRERLTVLYGEQQRFAVLNSHPGMRIEIGLPLEERSRRAGATSLRIRTASRVAGSHDRTKIRTIIVDDEALSRRGLEIRLLATQDFEIVAQCANGREAIAAIATHQPDLVFLDIQMPGMSGFDVLDAAAAGIACRWWCSSRPTTSTRSAPSMRARSTIC